MGIVKAKPGSKDDAGKFTVAPSGAPGKSAETTAKIVGTSTRTVERARNVISDPEEKQAVQSGEKSINKAAQDAKAKRTPLTPTEPVTSEADKRQNWR